MLRIRVEKNDARHGGLVASIFLSSGLASLSSAMRASVGVTWGATCGRVLSRTSACCTAAAKSLRSKLSRISQKTATLSRSDRSRRSLHQLRCCRLLVGGVRDLSQDAQGARVHRILRERCLRESADLPAQLRIAGVGGKALGGARPAPSPDRTLLRLRLARIRCPPPSLRGARTKVCGCSASPPGSAAGASLLGCSRLSLRSEMLISAVGSSDRRLSAVSGEASARYATRLCDSTCQVSTAPSRAKTTAADKRKSSFSQSPRSLRSRSRRLDQCLATPNSVSNARHSARGPVTAPMPGGVRAGPHLPA